MLLFLFVVAEDSKSPSFKKLTVHGMIHQSIACSLCLYTPPLMPVEVRYTPINIFYALLFKNKHNNNIIPCLILNTGLREK